MLYSILIYDSQDLLAALPEEEMNRRVGQHMGVIQSLGSSGKLGAAIKLPPTTTAVTLRGGPIGNTVIDGPFAETKEQLLGLYMVDVANLEEAVEIAKQLPRHSGSIEVRPVEFFQGGNLAPFGPAQI